MRYHWSLGVGHAYSQPFGTPMPDSNMPAPHLNPASASGSGSQLGPVTRSQARTRGIAAQGPSSRTGDPEAEASPDVVGDAVERPETHLAGTSTPPDHSPAGRSTTTNPVLDRRLGHHDEEEDSRSHGGSHDSDTDVSDGGLSKHWSDLSYNMERRKALGSDWDTEDEYMEEMYPGDDVGPEMNDT